MTLGRTTALPIRTNAAPTCCGCPRPHLTSPVDHAHRRIARHRRGRARAAARTIARSQLHTADCRYRAEFFGIGRLESRRSSDVPRSSTAFAATRILRISTADMGSAAGVPSAARTRSTSLTTMMHAPDERVRAFRSGARPRAVGSGFAGRRDHHRDRRVLEDGGDGTDRRLGGVGARGVGSGRIAIARRSAHVCRARRDVSRGGWRVRVPARRLRSVLRVPLRLDAVLDRHARIDRRVCGR